MILKFGKGQILWTRKTTFELILQSVNSFDVKNNKKMMIQLLKLYRELDHLSMYKQ